MEPQAWLRPWRGEVERRDAGFCMLCRLEARIPSSLLLSEVLDVVAEGARELLAADTGLVGLVDDASREVVVRAVSGARAVALEGLRVSLEAGCFQRTWMAGSPLIWEACRAGPDSPEPLRALADEGGISLLAVPLRRGECLLGGVGVMVRDGRRLTGREAGALECLARHASMAIDNAHLYREMRGVAVLEERDRLAREMHDDLAQALGYLNIKASVIDELLSAGRIEEARAGLRELKQIARETYTDVREAIFGLRAVVSPGDGLLPRLREYLADYRAHYGLDVRLVVDGEESIHLAPEVSIQVLRIVQEALANVRKHALAGQAWVRLAQRSPWLHITIRDDGCGFDPAQVAAGRDCFGLQIMRERAESVGGSLDVCSRPGEGARVSVRVPLVSEE